MIGRRNKILVDQNMQERFTIHAYPEAFDKPTNGLLLSIRVFIAKISLEVTQ